jgi:hypothetical protein
MFGFLRRPAPRPLSDAIRGAMEKDGLTPSVSNPSLLRMVEVGGRYSDRKVTYFRIFDPTTAAQRTLEIRRYKDFDVFPALVLRSGHVERDGKVVLTRPVGSRPAETASRTRAGRIVPSVDAAVADGTVAAPATSTVAEMQASGPMPRTSPM